MGIKQMVTQMAIDGTKYEVGFDDTDMPEIMIRYNKETEWGGQIWRTIDLRFVVSQYKPGIYLVITISHARLKVNGTGFDQEINIVVPSLGDDLVRLTREFIHTVGSKTNKNKIIHLTEKFLKDLRGYISFLAESYIS